MALSKDKLKSEIRKINDSTYEEFLPWPSSCDEARNRWSEAFYIYIRDLIPPSGKFEDAKYKMFSSLSGICSSSSLISSATIFQNSIIDLATETSNGIKDLNPILLGIPPSSELYIIDIFISTNNGDLNSEEFAENLSDRVHNYMKSGTAMNINTGLIIKWN